MKASLVIKFFALTMMLSPLIFAEPGFNGTTPGCGGSGCHTLQNGIVTATLLSNLQVRITLTGTTASVGGELVNESGNVVAVNNSTGNNPFILTAPSPGKYKVNAGYKNPSRRWDSTTVVIATTDIKDNLIENTPHVYKLHYNYPNPFNPSTIIRYQLSLPSKVSLRVYDVNGNEVERLVDELKAAGIHEVNFDAKGLASGIYFYKLQAGSFVETKKMMLLR